jgi:dephospho-CoA kinase
VKLLLCAAGEIASGKTTLTQELLDSLPDAARVSFGDVVRRRATETGMELNRSTLQHMGEQLVAGGWASFVALLASEVTTDPEVLIVDGIRHLAALDALRAQFPARKMILIYLDSDRQQQAARLAARGEDRASLAHPVERELSMVRDLADLVLSPESLEQQVATVLTQLQHVR